MSGAKIPSMEAMVCESCETIGSLMLATVRVLIYTMEKGNCYKLVPPLPPPPANQHTTAWSQEKESFKKRGKHLTAWNATERPNKKGTEKYLSFVGWSTKEPLNREGEVGVEAWPGERVSRRWRGKTLSRRWRGKTCAEYSSSGKFGSAGKR